MLLASFMDLLIPMVAIVGVREELHLFENCNSRFRTIVIHTQAAHRGFAGDKLTIRCVRGSCGAYTADTLSTSVLRSVVAQSGMLAALSTGLRGGFHLYALGGTR